MNKFGLRLAINALALYLAVGTGWIPYIHAENTQWWAYFVMALIFAVVNAVLGPLLKLLTCPLIFLTLGLFSQFIDCSQVERAQPLNLSFNFFKLRCPCLNICRCFYGIKPFNNFGNFVIMLG